MFNLTNLIKEKRYMVLSTILFSVFISITLIGCSQSQIKTSYNDEAKIEGLRHFDNYQLTQSTIVSRHNLRSALDEPGAPYINDTSVEFQKWESTDGDLTLKGAEEEVMLGKYFRNYFVSENLMEENWVPAEDQTYFYANSNQRTIATANYFSSGLLPTANINVVHKMEMGKNDPVFCRDMTKGSKEYQDQYYKEVAQNFNGNDFNGICKSIENNIRKMEDFLGFKDSKYAKENNLEHFPLDNNEMFISNGKGPNLKGTLKTANEIVDAFKMQYYEVEDDNLALFGKNISFKDLMTIFDVDNTYQKSVFDNHTFGVDRCNLLLKEIESDMQNQNRKVTFLSGHDNTLMTLLAALDSKDYDLKNTIDKGIPIGSKIVFNKFTGQDGQQYCDISLVYLTVDQIRHRYPLDLENPPMAISLDFDGIERNADGLFKLVDVEKMINKTIAEYNNWQ